MDRLVSRRTRILLLVGTAAAVAACGSREETASKSGSPFVASAAGTPAPTAPRPTPPAAIPLSDIPAEAERFEALRREVTAALPPGPELKDVDAKILRAENRVAHLFDRPSPTKPEEVQLVELQEQDLELRDLDAAGSELELALTARSRALDSELARLGDAQRRWSATLPEAVREAAPLAIQLRVSEILFSIDPLRAEVKSRRDEALTQLDRVSRIRSSLEAGRVEISERRRGAQRRLFGISEGPIWRVASAGRPVGRAAKERIGRDLRRLEVFLTENGSRIAVRFGIFIAAGLALLFALRGAVKETAKADPFARAPVRLIERPLAAATLTALMLLAWTRPPGTAPNLFRDAVWLLAILSTALLLSKLLGRGVHRSLWILTAAACLFPLRYLFEQDPLLDRLVLILQAGAVAATLAADLRAGVWKTVFQGRWQRAITVVLAVSVGLLTIALLLAIVGYVEPARLLRNGVIGSLSVGLISLGVYGLLYGFLSTLLATRAFRSLRVVQSRSEAIRRFFRRGLSTVLTVQWAFWALVVFGFGGPTTDLVERVLQSTLQIGSASISVTGILTFLAVLAGTFLLAAFVRFVLEGEILPRLRLPRGVPFTISTTARYAILLCGFGLAFSAAGISLSRFTLLAGALGVGLGFGLQNIVQNFVSGLILLFERPIQVGDYIDVGSLVGQVARIGMRSSTILTGEGAEVVVPNADLISKSVVNWTLSDRHRRIDIRVGAAYGTDPEKVIGLLLQAGSDHPEALPEPAPAAYFVGFGESSLDFVLQVWVARYEQAGALQSAIRRAVHRVLTENEVEIPFPQRDLNLRTVTPEASRALSGEQREIPTRR
jgi:small-conductance mechanosensitive channel